MIVTAVVEGTGEGYVSLEDASPLGLPVRESAEVTGTYPEEPAAEAELEYMVIEVLSDSVTVSVASFSEDKDDTDDNDPEIEPINVESVDGSAENVESVNEGSIDVEPIDVEPIDIELVDVELVDVEPIDVEPVDVWRAE